MYTREHEAKREPIREETGTEVQVRHVLVVEDDRDIRDAVVFLLRDAGYTVYEASDGKPAIERLHAAQERLVVVLDMVMPGLDGVAVLRAVAAHDALATRHAFILMSANEEKLPPPTLVTQVQAVVVLKPFDIDTLLAAVDEAAARLES